MKTNQDQDLSRALQSAVVANWAELVHGAQTGLVHIEYGFAPSGTLDFLQIWSSVSRGHWFLACSWWMSASAFHQNGVHFEKGYGSEGLAHTLESVMGHQNAFVLPQNLGRPGLIQVPFPTEAQIGPAKTSLREAFDPVSSTSAEPVLA